MPSTLIAAAGLGGMIVAFLSLFGWGRLIRRIAGLPDGGFAVSVGLGLASWIFLGGVLNLCRLAYPPALDAIVAVGLVLAAAALWKAGLRAAITACWPSNRTERAYRLVFYVLIATIVGFALAVQLAPTLYNPSDDFQKYFAQVARMVQTGTLFGSPLNALGSETLGGQAFLQGFIVGHFPIHLINGVDRVFCYALCLLLVAGISAGRSRLAPAGIAGMLLVFFIHPQYVNVSALYSAAALLMTLLLVDIDPREYATASARKPLLPMVEGLIYAGLVALKPTTFPFAALYFGFAVAARIYVERAWRPSLIRAFLTMAWAGLFIAPWIVLYLPYYVAGFLHPAGDPLTPIPDIQDHVSLFTNFATTYGAPIRAYTTIAAVLGVVAITALFHRRHRRKPTETVTTLTVVAACAAGISGYLLVTLVGVRLVEFGGALRYAIPIFIGIAPIICGLAPLVADDGPGDGPGRQGTWVSIACSVVLILMFFPAAVQRTNLILKVGSELSFLGFWPSGAIADLMTLENAAMHGDLHDEIDDFQHMIPAGEKFVAWIETPFLLDFKRNPIVDANDSGIGAVWAAAPDTGYVLWQYRGEGMPTPDSYLMAINAYGRRAGFVNARALDFYRHLETRARASKIVADQDGMGVLDLDAQ